MLDISSKRHGETVIVSIAGELDHHTATDAREKLGMMVEDVSMINMIIDLSELSFMDSSGIGVFIGRYKILAKRGGQMAVYGLNAHIKKIWKISGLYKIIKVYDNSQDALDSIREVG